MTGKQRKSIKVILSVPGVIGFFLPFTYDISPLDAASTWPRDWGLGSLGVIMGLALLVFLFLLRHMFSGRLSRFETVACVLLGLAGSLLIAVNSLYAVIMNGFDDPQNPWLMVPAMFVVWVLPATHLLVVLRFRKALLSVGSAAIAALMAGYLPNAIFCLLAFLGHWQIGAYAVLVACLCYAGMIAATTRLAYRKRTSS